MGRQRDEVKDLEAGLITVNQFDRPNDFIRALLSSSADEQDELNVLMEWENVKTKERVLSEGSASIAPIDEMRSRVSPPKPGSPDVNVKRQQTQMRFMDP
jgi:hypothetical protein